MREEEKKDGANRGGPRESQVTERASEYVAKMAGLYREERSWGKGREGYLRCWETWPWYVYRYLSYPFVLSFFGN